MADSTNSRDDSTLITPPPEDDLSVLREHLQPKYSVEKKLGSGGMADVYLGFHNQLKRQVAIKVLPRIFARDEGMVQRFMQEAESAAQLQHPNIINIFDIGRAGSLHYFIMAYVPGGSLKDVLAKKKKLDVESAVLIISQICSALNYAHQKGVIHRDIKPDNIMFDEHGHAILTDFGIAKAKFASRMTATGTLIGTPHYMSPEQLKGKEIDGRSDLYGLGIMFYEILTGKVPFEGDDTYSVGLKHIQEPPVPPLDLNTDIPEALNNIILTMLAKTPEARFQKAHEINSAIATVMEGMETTSSEIRNISRQAKAAVETWKLKKEDIESDFAEMKKTLDNQDLQATEVRKDTPQQDVHDSATVVRGPEPKPGSRKFGIIFAAVVSVIILVVIIVFLVNPFKQDEVQSSRNRTENVRNTEESDRRSAHSFPDYFEQNDLIYSFRQQGGLGVFRLNPEKDINEKFFTERPEVGMTAIDISYNAALQRFLVEQQDGRLITVNTAGFDVADLGVADTVSMPYPKMSAWSDDGSRIVFVKLDENTFQVKVADITEIGTLSATFSPLSEELPIVSPAFVKGDNSKIFYGRYDDTQDQSSIMFFDPNQEKPSVLFTVEGQVQDIAVVTGSQLACLTVIGGSTEIVIWNEGDDKPSPLIKDNDLGGKISATPDGRYLIYARLNGEQVYKLWAMDISRKAEIEVTDGVSESIIYPGAWILSESR